MVVSSNISKEFMWLCASLTYIYIYIRIYYNKISLYPNEINEAYREVKVYPYEYRCMNSFLPRTLNLFRKF